MNTLKLSRLHPCIHGRSALTGLVRVVAFLCLGAGLFSTDAAAQASPPIGFHVAQGVAVVGAGALIMGPPAGFAISVASYSVEPMLILGVGGYLVGGSMMGAGAVAAQTIARNNGHSVPVWPIAVSAGLLVVTPGIIVASIGSPPMGALAVATFIGGCGFGVGQIVANARGAAVTGPSGSDRVLRFDLMATPDGRLGLSGTW